MGKTISLKLKSEEEHIVNQIIKRGISPSELLREALLNYFSSINSEVDQKVNLNLQKEKADKVDQKVDQVDHEVNLLQEREVNLVDQKVNLLREEKVDQVNLHDKYLGLYIDQLNNNIHQLKDEIQEWKSKYDGEVQYLKESHIALQNEYHNHVKDSIKRIDDKFDRVMFYIEESRKPALQAPDMVDDPLKQRESKDAEKAKKGFVLKMYRM